MKPKDLNLKLQAKHIGAFLKGFEKVQDRYEDTVFETQQRLMRANIYYHGGDKETMKLWTELEQADANSKHFLDVQFAAQKLKKSLKAYEKFMKSAPDVDELSARADEIIKSKSA